MSKRVSIIFPYMTDDEQVLRRLHNTLRRVLTPSAGLHNSARPPVLVVNMDTIRKGYFEKFETLLKEDGDPHLLEELDVIQVWSVDTCQMWLAGFGKILKDEGGNEGSERDLSVVVQFPGDLKHLNDPEDFFQQMEALSSVVQTGEHHLMVGDFDVAPQDSKYLIDTYGTYPLLFNWFPDEAARMLREVRLLRPRSEFFAVSVRFLNHMLQERKFAYEQTIAFLIYALSDKTTNWNVGRRKLGSLADYEKTRRFREATDQIERTERMLKFLWRQRSGGDAFNVREYERLDRRSTSIREAAMVYLENVLGIIQ
jgi:hypothetical protein